MDKILVIPILVSFFVTLFLSPFWIRKAREIGLVWKDMNKLSTKLLSGSGGVITVLGFLIGVLAYVAYQVFYLKQGDGFLVELFALLVVVLMLSNIGFIDDLFGWRKGGLSKRSRIILVILASIPLIVINAGKSSMSIPEWGMVDIGIFYPLILIPLGIVGATTTYNFLAGFNGLEAGEGILLLSALAVVAYFTGTPWLSVVALCMVASLFAFLIFNFDPTIVFPGDVLTYSVGGLIAIIAILGNFEKIAVFFFIPIIIEFFLKARGKFIKQSFGKPKKDGTLENQHDKIYSLNHLSIYLMEKAKIEPTEKKVVFSIWLFQIIIILLGFIIFKEGIFG
jgi:UDP-N-acetylglucosamine--dolichyl-phosphate N-acetylglucosaminephosphotransferase